MLRNKLLVALPALALAVLAEQHLNQGKLPEVIVSASNPVTPAKIDLGRMLFYDPRLSKGKDVACNSCHSLDNYGVDGKPVSSGHKGQ